MRSDSDAQKIRPAMLNRGVGMPEPGYLEGVRALTKEYGVLLIFDEVKTGLTVAPGGGTEYWGVMPDMVAVARKTPSQSRAERRGLESYGSCRMR